MIVLKILLEQKNKNDEYIFTEKYLILNINSTFDQFYFRTTYFFASMSGYKVCSCEFHSHHTIRAVAVMADNG